MQRELSRRRLLASTGLLASGAAVAAAAGASSRGNGDGFDELPVRWNRTYGEDLLTAATAVVEGDGQYVGAGNTGNQTERMPWLFGVDATSGAGQWARTLENDDLETQPLLQDVVAAHDDGFVAMGVPLASGPTSLIKTSPTGEVEWWTTLAAGDENQSLFGRSVIATDDGYVVGGNLGNAQTSTAITVTVDAEGDELSRTTYFEDPISRIYGLRADGDGFVVAGDLREQPTGDEQPPLQANLFRVAPDRSVEWRSVLTDDSEAEGDQVQLQDAVPLEDGYLAVGNVITAGGSIQGWVVRTDDSGTGQATDRVTPQELTVLSSGTRSDDGVVVAGQVAESATSQTAGGWVGELDDSNEVRWAHAVAPSDQNTFQSVTATSDAGVVAAGSAQSNDTNADPLARALLTKLGGDEAPDLTETGPTPSPTPEPTATPTEEPTPTPTEEPTATPSPTPSPTATATPTAESENGVETPTPRPTETSPGSGPGFGVGTALAALGTGALLRRSGLLGDSDEE